MIFPDGSRRFEHERSTFSLQGTANLSMITIETLYLDNACTQPVSGGTRETHQLTFALDGSTKILTDGKVVDKARMTAPAVSPNVSVPAIMYTADNKIYVQINEPEAPVPVDSEGFPNSLDLNDYLTKVVN